MNNNHDINEGPSWSWTQHSLIYSSFFNSVPFTTNVVSSACLINLYIMLTYKAYPSSQIWKFIKKINYYIWKKKWNDKGRVAFMHEWQFLWTCGILFYTSWQNNDVPRYSTFSKIYLRDIIHWQNINRILIRINQV
jgi:hypothetical protein